MRICASALLVVLVVGGCAAPDQSFSPGEIDASTSTVAPPPVVVSMTSTVPVTTSTSTSPTSTTVPLISTTSTVGAVSAESAIVLSVDGLGVVSFGDSMDDALPILTDLLGPPISDEVHTDTWGEDSPIGYLRYVRWWSSVKLSLQFIDWDINLAPLDSPVLSYWGAGPGEIPLKTPDGVGPRTPWAEAAKIYGDRTSLSQASEECGAGWSFVIDGGAGANIPGTDLPLHGMLDGDPDDPETSITWMGAGREAFPQGC
jgi:hypothetical protein